MSRKISGRVTWLGVLLVALLCLVIAWVIFPLFARAELHNGPNPRTSRIKQLALACLMYAADHDNHLPLANNWMDATFAYTKNGTLYMDPELKDRKEGEYGFAYYLPVSGIDVGEVSNHAEVPLAFQSIFLHWNAYGFLSSVRMTNGGANVAFLDGHAKQMKEEWFQTPVQIKFRPPSETKRTMRD